MKENSENSSNVLDSITDQKNRMDIAMYYTHNDTEKANNMISGSYKDIYVIKVKFSVSTTYGAFIMFFNIPYTSLMHVFAIISHSYVVDDLKTKSEWHEYEEQMMRLNNKEGHDGEMTSRMLSELSQSFTLKMGAAQRGIELKKFLEMKDEISANMLIQKFIHDKFGFMNINLSVDYEQTSSLDVELYSKTSTKIDQAVLSSSKEKTGNKNAETGTKESDEDEEIDKKDIQLILAGTLTLSPIKGKKISDVEVGDRVRINLDLLNPKAVTVAKAFKAYDGERASPISGRVASIRHLKDGGYKLYCIIAKGIYVKINEDEEDVKVAVETAEEAESLGKSNTPYFVILVIIFIVLVAAAIIVVLK